MDKMELRRTMRRLNRAVAAEERRVASERILAAVERMPEFAAARCVALFCSLPDEPDTAAALERWRATKRVVVPRVEGDTMRFFEYDPATLETGAFGIAEPGAAAEECRPEQIDLVVVPGVAFTAAGARLGRGRGYYDKYLSQPGFCAAKIGVGYRYQMVAALPVEPHDVTMDFVVSECGRA